MAVLLLCVPPLQVVPRRFTAWWRGETVNGGRRRLVYHSSKWELSHRLLHVTKVSLRAMLLLQCVAYLWWQQTCLVRGPDLSDTSTMLWTTCHVLPWATISVYVYSIAAFIVTGTTKRRCIWRSTDAPRTIAMCWVWTAGRSRAFRKWSFITRKTTCQSAALSTSRWCMEYPAPVPSTLMSASFEAKRWWHGTQTLCL